MFCGCCQAQDVIQLLMSPALSCSVTQLHLPRKREIYKVGESRYHNLMNSQNIMSWEGHWVVKCVVARRSI